MQSHFFQAAFLLWLGRLRDILRNLFVQSRIEMRTVVHAPFPSDIFASIHSIKLIGIGIFSGLSRFGVDLFVVDQQ